MASDGKIYVARFNQLQLGVINNPNAVGSACNYVEQALSITSGTIQAGLPNFVSSSFLINPQSTFIHTVTQNCTTSFTLLTPLITQQCASAPQPTSVIWNFGDPLSGAANTSTVLNPTHGFSASGMYSVQVIENYACHSDTVRQLVNVSYPTPNLSISGGTDVCVGKTLTLTASGASTYSWSNNSNTASVSVSPTTSTMYSVIGSNTLNGCSSTLSVFIKVLSCVGIPEMDDRNFKIFPNPTGGILFMESPLPCEITVYNQVGEVITSDNISTGEKKMDLGKFSAGIYYIRIQNPKAHTNYYKIIKTD